MSDAPDEEVEQTDPVTALTDAVDQHDDDDDQPGAPVGRVVEEMLTDSTIDLGDVSHALKEAYFHGVVYQPSPSTVARVATDGGVDQEKGLHHGPMMQAKQDPNDNEYATPPDLWRRLAEPVGGFDVDPCSGAESTPIASTRFTKEDDGLRQAWHGDVFVNPPWSNEGDASAKEQWLSKCRAEAKRDDVDSVVVLLPSDTSAGWFHEHVLAAEIVCFYGPGRLSFEGGGKNPSFGLLIAAYGDDADAYRDVLTSEGAVIEGRRTYEPTTQSKLVTDGGVELPDDHPLAPYSDQLDTHAGHIDAYGSALKDADPDETHGVMLVMYGADGVETLPTVSVDVDPRFASLWMLGAHIHHVAESAQGAGGNATMETVAQDAIQYVRQNGLGGIDQ